jgi:hypothetical protein
MPAGRRAGCFNSRPCATRCLEGRSHFPKAASSSGIGDRWEPGWCVGLVSKPGCTRRASAPRVWRHFSQHFSQQHHRAWRQHRACSPIRLIRAKKAPDSLCCKEPGEYLATTYSHRTCRPTTIGAAAFHFRVRNGTGWFHRALVTRGRPLSKRAGTPATSSLRSIVCCLISRVGT